MNILAEFKQRGLFSQCSNESALEQALLASKAIYAGFDPTADSLHVGNLIPILCLKRFANAGFDTIALVGGATGLIGDPSGKAQERPESIELTVAKNSQFVKQQLESFSGSKVVNNIDWVKNLSVLDFMRQVGKHASLAEMLSRDSIKSRLEAQSGISFTEFSYMLFQAYDFFVLSQNNNCLVQIGGSDQFGNMCSGLGLISKTNQQGAVLTFPLLTTSDGKKFGKSEAGAVWLSAEKTSVWDFYQFWINSTDEDAIKLLKMFTFLSLDEISDIEQRFIQNPQHRLAQKTLAFEVTSFIHGQKAAEAVKRLSEALFTNDFSVLSESDIAEISQDHCIPLCRNVSLKTKQDVVTALVQSSLVESKTQANQLIKSKAVSIVDLTRNAQILVDDSFNIEHTGPFLIKKGKKSFVLVV